MENEYLPAPATVVARRVRRALDGGPVVAPLPRVHGGDPPEGTALIVRTSGSTGTPREVALTAEALRASATATHERLGGPGRWVLTLPATHIAGLQVVVRSLLAADAGVPDPLVATEPGAPFTPDALAALLTPALADGAPVHVSLVPTQLHRVLAAADDGAPSGLEALARCASVLLGGAATPPPLLARALASGVPVVRTYGMSETAGGCVYDGLPLDGVRVRVVPTSLAREPRAGDPGTPGVIELAGPTLAAGYVGDAAATAASFRVDDGVRWFRTSDLGTLGPHGVLSVLGRADDVIVTGGVNVAPAAVEAALAEVLPALLGVAAVEPCVVGVPDDEWGQAVIAVVAVPDGAGSDRAGTDRAGTDRAGTDRAGTDRAGTGRASGARGAPRLTALEPESLARVRDAVAARLGAPSAPRRVHVTCTLPLRGPGKVDRRAVAEVAAAQP